MEGDLRVLGAGLHAEVAARPLGVERVAREVRQVGERLGPAVREPEPVSATGVAEHPGPKPKVIVRPPGGSPMASPVSSGGTSGAPSVGPTGPAGSPCVIRSAAAVHAFNNATSCPREPVVMSKAAKWSRSWAGVTMPAWCVPRKGYDAATAVAVLASSRSA